MAVDNNLIELTGLKSVESFDDIVKLNEFVFTTVPWISKPNTLNDLNSCSLPVFLEKCQRMEVGGWCGLTAVILERLLHAYGIPNRGFDYGIREHKLTHVVINANYRGIEYLVDPYFGVRWCNQDGSPLEFHRMLKFIENREFDAIKTVHSVKNKKVIYKDENLEWTSKQMLDKIISAWKRNRDFDNVVSEAFGGTNPFLLMLREVI